MHKGLSVINSYKIVYPIRSIVSTSSTAHIHDNSRHLVYGRDFELFNNCKNQNVPKLGTVKQTHTHIYTEGHKTFCLKNFRAESQFIFPPQKGSEAVIRA